MTSWAAAASSGCWARRRSSHVTTALALRRRSRGYLKTIAAPTSESQGSCKTHSSERVTTRATRRIIRKLCNEPNQLL